MNLGFLLGLILLLSGVATWVRSQLTGTRCDVGNSRSAPEVLGGGAKRAGTYLVCRISERGTWLSTSKYVSGSSELGVVVPGRKSAALSQRPGHLHQHAHLLEQPLVSEIGPNLIVRLVISRGSVLACLRTAGTGRLVHEIGPGGQ